MHRMSKESASAFSGLQARLIEAETILTILLNNDDIDREYITSLITTYFSPIKTMERNNEKKI